MKKIIYLISALIMILFIAAETRGQEAVKVPKSKPYSYLESIDRSKVQSVRVGGDSESLGFDPANPVTLLDEAGQGKKACLALVRIISLDKADTPANDPNSPDDYKQVDFPYTYGKFEVLTNITGEMPAYVDFVRPGGVMKEKDIYKNSDPLFREKIDSMRKAAGEPIVEESDRLLDMRFGNDISLEVGKLYLVASVWQESWKRYVITGFQFGSLEVNDVDQPVDKRMESKGNAKGQGRGKQLGKNWTVKNLAGGEDLYQIKDNKKSKGIANGQEKNLLNYLRDSFGIDLSNP